MGDNSENENVSLRDVALKFSVEFNGKKGSSTYLGRISVKSPTSLVGVLSAILRTRIS